MKIVFGTYDGGLMGWESDLAADPSGRTLQLTFAFAGHDGSVRCVALNEKGPGSVQSTLVSGGSDEIIRVFDLIKHKEVGSLLEHKSAVTAVDFFRTSHMLSGSQDGTVCVWRVADWLCLDNMRGHKAAVNSISIHPSGRLALSVAADKGLVMWDLTKGKPAYSTKLPGAANRVAWASTGAVDETGSPTASHFVIAYDACLAIHSGTSGKVIRVCGPGDSVLEAKDDPEKASALAGSIGAGVFGSSRICDMVLVNSPEGSNDSSSSSGKQVKAPAKAHEAAASSSSSASAGGSVLAVLGHEGGDVSVWEVPSGRLIRRFATGHAKRVRCVAFCDGIQAASTASAASASSAAAAAPLSSAAADDLNPLSKLASAAKGRVVLPSTLTKDDERAGFLVTADSEGQVKIWRARQVLSSSSSSSSDDDEKVEPLATLSAASGSRITALAVNRAAAGSTGTASAAASAAAEIGSSKSKGGKPASASSSSSSSGAPSKGGAGGKDSSSRKVGEKTKARPHDQHRAGGDDDEHDGGSSKRGPSNPKKAKVAFAVKVTHKQRQGGPASGSGAAPSKSDSGAGVGAGSGKAKKAVRFG